jgi:predicted ATP-dependent endonuclease of OLD family
MILDSIQIKNYRSIEDVAINFQPLRDGSFTYGLIGMNEAGKSSILKALALKDELIELETKDFKDKSKEVEVIYFVSLEKADKTEIESTIAAKSVEEDKTHTQAAPTGTKKGTSKSAIETTMALVISYDYENVAEQNVRLDAISDFLQDNPDKDIIQDYVLENLPESIFWTAEDRYLISKPITLSAFAADPGKISIPLKNCFLLAGFNDIDDAIDGISDSTEKEHLQTRLGEKVTEHIRTVWPNHPIKISFLISDGLIHFHVKDDKSSGKAKTADQRSDGFKQFVSFLLTVSAQSKNEQLANSILLLDEPETHLHPQGQQYLLQEMVKITSNKRRNVAFFATHSIFMIDRDDLSRNLRVQKVDERTEFQQFDRKNSSYSSILYEVFGIPSNDYHNELYGELLFINGEVMTSEFDKFLGENGAEWTTDTTKGGKKERVTKQTQIRNAIHHPENKKKQKIIQEELIKSIEFLRGLLEKFTTEEKPIRRVAEKKTPAKVAAETKIKSDETVNPLA